MQLRHNNITVYRKDYSSDPLVYSVNDYYVINQNYFTDSSPSTTIIQNTAYSELEFNDFISRYTILYQTYQYKFSFLFYDDNDMLIPNFTSALHLASSRRIGSGARGRLTVIQ